MVERRDAVADLLGDESPMAELASLAAAAAPAVETEAEKGEKPAAKPAKKKRISAANDRPCRANAKKASAVESRAKRMMVSPEEEQIVDELVSKIGRAVGTKVAYTQVARSMFGLLLATEDGLEQVKGPRLRRPGNGDLGALAEFEDELARYLLEVFRRARKQHR